MQIVRNFLCIFFFLWRSHNQHPITYFLEVAENFCKGFCENLQVGNRTALARSKFFALVVLNARRLSRAKIRFYFGSTLIVTRLRSEMKALLVLSLLRTEIKTIVFSFSYYREKHKTIYGILYRN